MAQSPRIGSFAPSAEVRSRFKSSALKGKLRTHALVEAFVEIDEGPQVMTTGRSCARDGPSSGLARRAGTRELVVQRLHRGKAQLGASRPAACPIAPTDRVPRGRGSRRQPSRETRCLWPWLWPGQTLGSFPDLPTRFEVGSSGTRRPDRALVRAGGGRAGHRRDRLHLRVRVREVIHNFNTDRFDTLAPRYSNRQAPKFARPDRE